MGAVTEPDEDLVERGRAIFDRLRGHGPLPTGGDPPGGPDDVADATSATTTEPVDAAVESAPSSGKAGLNGAAPVPASNGSGPAHAAVEHPSPADAGPARDSDASDALGPPPPTAADRIAAPGPDEPNEHGDGVGTVGPAPRADATAGADGVDPGATHPATPSPPDTAPEDLLTTPPPPDPAPGEPVADAPPSVGAAAAAAGTAPPPASPDGVLTLPPAPEATTSTPPAARSDDAGGPDVVDLPDPTVASPPAPRMPRRALPRVMAVANQKGGVGKTTTTVNLGAALAEMGYRVLAVDLDPQGNATTGLGINARNLDASVYDVIIRGIPVEDCIEPTSVRNLFMVPSTIDLAGAEIELVPAFSRELKLKKGLEGVAGDFDFTLIDCPPSLGLLTVNGLAAAGEVVVPIQCEYYALEGLGQLLRNVGLVQTNINPTLELSTIILTMYDARTKLAEQVANQVRAHFGNKVCRNVVPRTVRLSEAPSFGQPIIVFDSSSRGAIAYRELAKEVSGGAPQRVG
jgi:chromosome partitioning protein